MPTSVDTTHPQYDAHEAQWRMMRDVSAGESAVKAAGGDYLPKLGGQDAEQYNAYRMRASFYNATGRTIDGLSGMVFRKPPVITRPDGMAEFEDDVTLNGISLTGFAEQAVEEVLTTGRAGVLVDFPRIEAGGLTRAAADRMNLRPFFSLYAAASILNWRLGQIGNRTELTQVRLHEVVSEPVEDDEFAEEEVEQIRVLELASAREDGTGPLLYRQRVFRKDGEEWAQHGDDIVPLRGGAPLEFIPFVFLGPRDSSPHVCKPPLVDLAYLNLSHYRTCADLEHGAHFTALPTPYIFGLSEKEQEETYAIGPETIWMATSNEVKAGLLEFQGQGLEALETRRDVKEQQMASLGARMLAPEKRMAEAAETASIHRQGEISVLASLAKAVSIALTEALEMARDWMQMGGEVLVELNRDYLPTRMDPQMLTALFQMVQGGRISRQTFFENLKEGEIIAPDKSFEDEEEEIAENGPALGLMGREDPEEAALAAE